MRQEKPIATIYVNSVADSVDAGSKMNLFGSSCCENRRSENMGFARSNKRC